MRPCVAIRSPARQADAGPTLTPRSTRFLGSPGCPSKPTSRRRSVRRSARHGAVRLRRLGAARLRAPVRARARLSRVLRAPRRHARRRSRAGTTSPPCRRARSARTDLACGPAEAVFRTSGTSGGADARGRHLVPHLDLYRASALPTFARFVAARRCPAAVPLPAAAAGAPARLVARPHVRVGRRTRSAPASSGSPGPTGLDVGAPGRSARRARRRRGEAVLLAGPTAGFVRLFDAGRRRFGSAPGAASWTPAARRASTRPISRAGFLRACWTHLGIPTYYCVNEYGMTELCSQRYDSVLRDRFDGRSLAPRRLVGPPWLRTRVLDPDTLGAVAPGATGLLCHHDLANAGSVSVVLTEDLGRTVGDDGIEVARPRARRGAARLRAPARRARARRDGVARGRDRRRRSPRARGSRPPRSRDRGRARRGRAPLARRRRARARRSPARPTCRRPWSRAVLPLVAERARRRRARRAARSRERAPARRPALVAARPRVERAGARRCPRSRTRCLAGAAVVVKSGRADTAVGARVPARARRGRSGARRDRRAGLLARRPARRRGRGPVARRRRRRDRRRRDGRRRSRGASGDGRSPTASGRASRVLRADATGRRARRRSRGTSRATSSAAASRRTPSSSSGDPHRARGAALRRARRRRRRDPAAGRARSTTRARTARRARRRPASRGAGRCTKAAGGTVVVDAAPRLGAPIGGAHGARARRSTTRARSTTHSRPATVECVGVGRGVRARRRGAPRARRRAHLPRRPHAAPAHRLAARAAAARSRRSSAPRANRVSRSSRERRSLRALPAPRLPDVRRRPWALVVARAPGRPCGTTDGRAYLDLLAGMGVANVGHAHPEVVAAVRAQPSATCT